MSLGEYLLRRLGLGVLVIIGVLMVTFVVSQIIPGDPARLYTGPRASREQVEKVREELGLNDPVPVQFVGYVTRILRGDFGFSVRSKRPILEDIKLRLPATMELVIVALFLSMIVGVPAGVLGAAKRGKVFDQASRLAGIGGVSIPHFWLALLLQLMFFLYLGWLPLGGRISQDIMFNHPIERMTGFFLIDAAVTGNWVAWRDVVWHMIMPVIVLAPYPTAVALRMTRASMLDVLSETYITAARAAGLREREILFKLALKNGILPTLTIIGLEFAFLITGSVFVEIVFSWPGIGKYMADAILNSDIFVVFGVTIIVTFIYIAVNLVVDLIQAALDPRVRLGGGREV
jgi:peptide/nickel transport system permease protein